MTKTMLLNHCTGDSAASPFLFAPASQRSSLPSAQPVVKQGIQLPKPRKSQVRTSDDSTVSDLDPDMDTSRSAHNHGDVTAATDARPQSWSQREDESLVRMVRGPHPDWHKLAAEFNELGDGKWNRTDKDCRDRYLMLFHLVVTWTRSSNSNNSLSPSASKPTSTDLASLPTGLGKPLPEPWSKQDDILLVELATALKHDWLKVANGFKDRAGCARAAKECFTRFYTLDQ